MTTTSRRFILFSYRSLNCTGRSTHIATGSLPRRAGSNRQRLTASAAAASRSGWPADCFTTTSPTWPSAATNTRSSVVPWMPARRALVGYDG